jgi:heterotetrameric sarcosine oxidase gamma subunit
MLQHRSALAAHTPTPGAPHAPVQVSECRGRAILQVSAFLQTRSQAAERLTNLLGMASPEPNRYCAGAGKSLRMVGPGVWLVVGAPACTPSAAVLRAAMENLATVVDLGQASTVLLLGGPAARKTLAKHCSLDLDDSCFPTGSATLTRFGRVGAGLARINDTPQFELTVARSHAESVRGLLEQAAGEFGGLAVVADPAQDADGILRVPEGHPG